MFSRILDALFGCGHKHYSFPITVKKGRRSPAACVTGTYVVCLDCGKEFAYDWKQMKIVSPHGERVAVASLATKQAA
jgi:predicted transcriptional regulator